MSYLICNGKNQKGQACRFKAKEGHKKCGRCLNKARERGKFKKGIDNPNGLNFGGRGWSAFLPKKIIELAEVALNTPDYFNLTQEVEYDNVDIARLTQALGEELGLPFEKWSEHRKAFKELKAAWYDGDALLMSQKFAEVESLLNYCFQQHCMRKEMHTSMDRKARHIQQQQAIKEKERLFVDLSQMLVFGAQLIQVIDSVMPKSDKVAKHYRLALFSALAPKFGFEMNRTTKKLKPMTEDEILDTEEDYIIEAEYELHPISEDSTKPNENGGSNRVGQIVPYGETMLNSGEKDDEK